MDSKRIAAVRGYLMVHLLWNRRGGTALLEQWAYGDHNDPIDLHLTEEQLLDGTVVKIAEQEIRDPQAVWYDIGRLPRVSVLQNTAGNGVYAFVDGSRRSCNLCGVGPGCFWGVTIITRRNGSWVGGPLCTDCLKPLLLLPNADHWIPPVKDLLLAYLQEHGCVGWEGMLNHGDVLTEEQRTLREITDLLEAMTREDDWFDDRYPSWKEHSVPSEIRLAKQLLAMIKQRRV